jgi:hypothetical protein
MHPSIKSKIPVVIEILKVLAGRPALARDR